MCRRTHSMTLHSRVGGGLHYMKPFGGVSSACWTLMSCNSHPFGGGEIAVRGGVAPRSPPVPSGALHACHTNFACNSLVTISNVEFIALKSQRFQTLLNLHPIELHATFGEAQDPPPPTGTAAAYGYRIWVL